jgi:hypothetical protein
MADTARAAYQSQRTRLADPEGSNRKNRKREK